MWRLSLNLYNEPQASSLGISGPRQLKDNTHGHQDVSIAFCAAAVCTCHHCPADTLNLAVHAELMLLSMNCLLYLDCFVGLCSQAAHINECNWCVSVQSILSGAQ